MKEPTKHPNGAKFDYDSDEFYDEIFALALNGATDKEIAFGLEEHFGVSLSPINFGKMIRGNYAPWTDEENERRSARLNRVLEHGRNKINMLVRTRYLKAALGGIVTKNVTKRRMQIDGQLTDNEIIQTSEIELPPNMQALSMWLYHHDPEWRNIQKGLEAADEEINGENGVDIAAWIDLENTKRRERAEAAKAKAESDGKDDQN